MNKIRIFFLVFIISMPIVIVFSGMTLRPQQRDYMDQYGNFRVIENHQEVKPEIPIRHPASEEKRKKIDRNYKEDMKERDESIYGFWDYGMGML